MIAPPRRSFPRWIGVVTSVVLLVLVAAAAGLSSGRVRNRVFDAARGPAPTVTPAGVVISLSQLPDITAATTAPTATVPVAAAPFGTIGTVALIATATTGNRTAAAAPTVLATAPAALPATGAANMPGAMRPAGVSVAAATPTTATAPVPVPTIAVPTIVPPTPPLNALPTPPPPAMATAVPPPPAPMAAPMPVPMPIPTATPQPPPAPLAPIVAPPAPTATPLPVPTPTTAPMLAAPPNAVFLQPMSHWYQTWNNCSGVAAAMAVSYFGLPIDPLALSTAFRPNPNDKTVEPGQMVEYLQSRGLKAQTLEGGTIDRVRRLVASGVPVIVMQWQNRTDHAGIGHYRVVRGYDEAKQLFVANDSMTGPSQTLSYAEFDDLWGFYDYRYIPVWNDKLAPAVARVLGEDADPAANVRRAVTYMERRVAQQPQNAELQFGLGGAYFLAGDDARAIAQYRKAREMGMLRSVPYTLWYQFWPVTALVNTGQHDEALQLAAENIANAGAFAEMRHERGRVFEAQGDAAAARREYRAALVDDKNFQPSQLALARLGG